MSNRKWDELSGPQQTVVLGLACLQLSLAVTAWADLATRSPSQVVGSKRKWAAIIGVNLLGPALYFWRGIRR